VRKQALAAARAVGTYVSSQPVHRISLGRFSLRAGPPLFLFCSPRVVLFRRNAPRKYGKSRRFGHWRIVGRYPRCHRVLAELDQVPIVGSIAHIACVSKHRCAARHCVAAVEELFRVPRKRGPRAGWHWDGRLRRGLPQSVSIYVEVFPLSATARGKNPTTIAHGCGDIAVVILDRPIARTLCANPHASTSTHRRPCSIGRIWT
jgi:hypothetical protein